MRRVLVTALVAAVPLALPLQPLPAQASPADTGCHLDSAGGAIQHVIILQFDNAHFRRDNPNVPSDIEQMPSLYHFLVSNGTVLTNHHTPLIAHTGTDILTSLTGVYPDHHGQAVSNTFLFYDRQGTTHTALTFAYWTDLTKAFDGTNEGKFNLLTAEGKNAPAPWVPFTRAGCNVGGVATANIELERRGNVATVYGAGSPEALEAGDPAQADQTTADFIGIAVHCARGAAMCAAASHGQPDLLPGEPGGYLGFNGLFGHKYVAPRLNPSGPLQDLDGQVITNSSSGTPGFPGFNGMTAAISLSYVAAMQEHGVPVTYAYLSAVHEVSDTGLGPGDPQYEQNLRNYDEAFGKFFNRLAADGITKQNTLLVVAGDENDHFVGAGPLNPGCNGVTVACQYDPNRLGNVEVALDTELGRQGITTSFDVHDDSAPAFYLEGNPAQTDAVTRQFERGIGRIQVTNPLSGNSEPLTNFMADRAELKLMHMVTADPQRTPTFIQFEKPDYHGVISPLDCSDTATVMLCPGVEVWNHGDLHPDINVTWLGLAGPGVRHLGIDPTVWSDHTDIRPTLLSLVGLRDDYQHDGRVLVEVLDRNAVAPTLRGFRETLVPLAQVYKQINAPVAQLAMDTVQVSTRAMESGSPSDDSVYVGLDAQIAAITSRRDAIAAQIAAQLEGAAFGGRPLDVPLATDLIRQAQDLLAQAAALAM
jgi:hypothetical protein